MADLSKCFFQILLPRDQRDLFRILWFSNDDIERGKLQSYHFTRHVWGIISSPFIACYAIHRLSLDNPTNASDVAINPFRTIVPVEEHCKKGQYFCVNYFAATKFTQETLYGSLLTLC